MLVFGGSMEYDGATQFMTWSVHVFKNIFLCFAFLTPFGLFATGCGGSAPAVKAQAESQPTAQPTSQPTSQTAAAKSGHACAACTKGKSGETVWCDKCGHGFVKGKKTGCKACFKGKSGESVWCEKCGHGFVDGKKTGCKGCYAKKTGAAESCGGCKKPAAK